MAPAPLLQVTLDNGSTVTIEPPPGGSISALPNGFAPKAKIVILAACGITSAFTGYWHLADGQALIVPVYADGSDNEIDLVKAGADVQWMLDQLSSGLNVGQAVDLANQANGNGTAGYTWTVIPAGGRNVTFNISSH